MDKKDSLWDLFQQKNLSRRTFLKTCVAITGILGLSPAMVPEVVAAAEKKPLVPVIWLHGHECTGCDEAFIRSQSPLASDVVLNMISLEYSDTLAAAAGEPFEHHLADIMKRYAGKYILAVEGAVPLADEGIHCMVGGKTFLAALKEAAKGAAAIIEYGSCAAWGGIQAAKPNPTKSVSISDVLGNSIPIVKVPGCPPIPEVMTGVVMHYALFGQLPPLDSKGRPKQFYGNRIHDTCYRRPFFDSGMFVEKFDDAGSKAGWCLYKVGCRGPEAYNSCGNLRWWNGLSYPIQSGHGCIACGNNNFWDNGPFYERLPNIPVPNTIANADKVGMVAAGVAAAGVTVHGLLSAVQKRSSHSDNSETRRTQA
ncbi:hydrogenase small subunit [Sporolituus thermophilus]|uniref:Hydrogenase small subunit n=1 Tax=Sporolituus thermophilus DSM 23256 TaxID=1123285 RepID=A0A1G7JJ32_9FIRM|nr:hydrogenase small subunit [Sporolituus thermophilus]SDF24921.1 hydrogenase small subunit [Sporolituus thermophilus DSM 23256]